MRETSIDMQAQLKALRLNGLGRSDGARRRYDLGCITLAGGASAAG